MSNTYTTIRLRLHFTGGAETLFEGKRDHEVDVPISDNGDNGAPLPVSHLLQWILFNLLPKTCDRPELLISNGNIRPGILLLINDTDWEILGGLDAPLHDNDVVTFISTLHGG